MTTSNWTRRRALRSGAKLLGAAMATSAAAAFAAAPQTEGYAAVPGGRIFWRKFGSGGKTPLLTLHGGPGSSHNYLLPLQALADERPVIFYDQLGCGRADAPENESVYSIQRSVDEVDAVRAALGLDRVLLLGHSWGALLAVEYLCQGRGRGVERLILSGAMASIPQVMAGFDRLFATMPEGWSAKIHALEKAGKTATPEYAELVQKFYDTFVLRVSPSPEVLATLEALSKSPAYRVLNGPNEFTIVGKIKDWDRRKDLTAISQRTLITTGEFDEITLDCHETLRDGIAGKARLAVMTGCSHLTMNEKPEQYNALLRGFMNEA
ncbi:proline iminopeptidase-family hydrolase [Caulobacter rhizosphaerae]|jgi:proline iminopeptidase|uniref:proline iminopeptidase-family hydrolase n=1 Tax=Caulobacter rhizosphaerae TaxID=2010972 RepID=UPI0013D2C76C|nr:proline iminopeptidase-family hydrolase [Caulobacter rhizosphaerae]GGL14954.1 proline iminopeptidase [Caulobacter rhizosphaerae]